MFRNSSCCKLTDLSRFAWQYGRTDRQRPSVSYHVADTHSLYELRISRLFTPLRTFELDAAPSLEHTVWTDLLLCSGEDRETVSRGEQAQRRGRIFSAQHMTGHDRAAKDLGYSVLADAWPVGNGRCWKKGQATHMLCDTCYCVYAAQSEGVSEEVGAMGGERLGLLGRARAALGRLASAIPRTLRNPWWPRSTDPFFL